MIAGKISTEPDVYVDADTDAEMMLSWEIKLVFWKKLTNDKQWTTTTTLEVSAISAAKNGVDADADTEVDADADADSADELSNFK